MTTPMPQLVQPLEGPLPNESSPKGERDFIAEHRAAYKLLRITGSLEKQTRVSWRRPTWASKAKNKSRVFRSHHDAWRFRDRLIARGEVSWITFETRDILPRPWEVNPHASVKPGMTRAEIVEQDRCSEAEAEAIFNKMVPR